MLTNEVGLQRRRPLETIRAAEFMTPAEHWAVWSWQLIGTVRLSQAHSMWPWPAFKDSEYIHYDMKYTTDTDFSTGIS